MKKKIYLHEKNSHKLSGSILIMPIMSRNNDKNNDS